MNSRPEVRISNEQARLFAIAVGGTIAEYVKNHQAEYELFLLEEKKNDNKLPLGLDQKISAK